MRLLPPAAGKGEGTSEGDEESQAPKTNPSSSTSGLPAGEADEAAGGMPAKLAAEAQAMAAAPNVVSGMAFQPMQEVRLLQSHGTLISLPNCIPGSSLHVRCTQLTRLCSYIAYSPGSHVFSFCKADASGQWRRTLVTTATPLTR